MFASAWAQMHHATCFMLKRENKQQKEPFIAWVRVRVRVTRALQPPCEVWPHPQRRPAPPCRNVRHFLWCCTKNKSSTWDGSWFAIWFFHFYKSPLHGKNVWSKNETHRKVRHIFVFIYLVPPSHSNYLPGAFLCVSGVVTMPRQKQQLRGLTGRRGRWPLAEILNTAVDVHCLPFSAAAAAALGR